MVIDNNESSFNNLNRNKQQIPKKLHSNEGIISFENSLLTKNINTFSHTDPTNTQDMRDKSVAILHERYKNNLINKKDFNKHCNNIGKNKQ